jgi:lipopolysaccharide export system permease protein
MKRLHFYIIKSFVGPLILTFFIVLFIQIMQFLWKYIDDLVGKGLNLPTISELLFYFSVSFVPLALPLAILLAALMTFGNLGENLELTALKSSGISLQKIMSPLIFFVTFLSICAFFFSNNILPRANLKARSLLYDITRQRPEINIKKGEFYNGIDGISIKIADREPRTNLLRKILVYDHRDKAGNISVTYADSGYMKITQDTTNLIFTLYHGYSYNEVIDQEKRRRRRLVNTYPHRRDVFDEQELILELSGFGLNRTDEDLFKNQYAMLNLQQLSHFKDSLTKDLEDRKEIFFRTLQKTHLLVDYSSRISLKNASGINDSAKAAIFNPEKVIEELTQPEKEASIEKALIKARETKNYISSSKDNLIWRAKNIRRYQIEWHRKLTLSFACFIFFFIGAPLGAIIRKGGLGTPIVISVIFFIIYYIISLSGEKFVREIIILPFAGMWFSSFVLLPIGAFLTYKATVDSAILNVETYINFFKKLFKIDIESPEQYGGI